MNIGKIKKFLEDHKQPKFRLKQILKAVYQDGVSAFSEITTLPKALGHEMSKLEILSFEVEKVLEAKDGKSAKVALKLSDGNIIETVLMSPMPNTYSVCVSTQAGCPMGCAFCATGEGGFKRNLTAEEIVDQVLFWRQWLRRSGPTATSGRTATRSIQNSKIGNWDLNHSGWTAALGETLSPSLSPEGRGGIVNNIVFMGMGEPFLNWESVKESLKILTDPGKFGFGSRSISVSTCGIPDGIIEFGKTFPQINLAISLHFADDERRSKFMPVNRKYNLEELKKALQEYFLLTRRKVFIEYIMLDGINDSLEDAEKLVNFLRGIKGENGEKGVKSIKGERGERGSAQLLHVHPDTFKSGARPVSHFTKSAGINSQVYARNVKGVGVNLIQYNQAGGKLKASSNNKTHAFKNFLLQNKINVTIRQSLGEEIQGACGQLAGTA